MDQVETLQKSPNPVFAVSAILVSMGLIAISSGLMFAYIPVKLAGENFAPWVAGTMITAMAGGGIAGCLATGLVVRRVGHSRAFVVMAALETLSFLAMSIGTIPALWIVSRFAYGLAVTGLFIIAQSWLNDATGNEWRGRVIALFYMIYILCIGIGSIFLRFAPLEGATIPLIAVAAVTLGTIPIALTVLPPPSPPESIAIAFRSVWLISPVGLVGLLCVGGLTMMVQGYAPIYAAAIGYGKEDIGLLLFLMQLGMLVVQMPLGAWSDKTDRRRVLVVAGIIILVLSGGLFFSDTRGYWELAVILALWSGATESIYSIANAHANDRAEPQYYVSLSSTLLIAWSISGFIIPAITTAITPIGGPKTFMLVAAAIAGFYTLFVLARLFASEPVPEEETEPYVAISASIPYSTELATGDVDPDIEQLVPDPEILAEELEKQAESLLSMLRRDES